MKHDLTYPGHRNTKSKKEPLPQKCLDAILSVARQKLKGKELTMAQFIHKLQQRFSSLKIKVRTPNN